jgi:glycerate dehydrogenase
MILVVTFQLAAPERALVSEVISSLAEVRYLPDLDDADVLLATNTGKELQPQEIPLIKNVRLVQFLSAGVDHIPLSQLPPNVPLAKNAGAYADPMAEHVLAMALAAAKRLLIEDQNLKEGEFNQFVPNRMLRGRTCGFYGFGGIGIATARLMRCIGMRIHAMNRHPPPPNEHVDWFGTPNKLDEMLPAVDVFVICVPLTRQTEGTIAKRQLGLMKADAILVNVARGEIIDENDLYDHLRTHPRFTACIDAWWIEPVRQGEFRMDHPFLELPNAIGSPHNSPVVADMQDIGLQHALANCRRVLQGEPPLHLVGADERMH